LQDIEAHSLKITESGYFRNSSEKQMSAVSFNFKKHLSFTVKGVGRNAELGLPYANRTIHGFINSSTEI
jgi:hypothetical protein